MRRSRRGRGGHEFGGSGEDSFVAVVVTKLTGALLFILLLTMVIMALIPKAVDARRPEAAGESQAAPPLAIATPEALPEAIAGRSYAVALAATGGVGPRRWAVDGPLPAGLAVDPTSGLISGTPKAGTPRPAELVVRVADDAGRAAQAARLVVYEPDNALTLPSRWAPGLPPVPWRAWLDRGFGFLVLWLAYLAAAGSIGSLERSRRAEARAGGDFAGEAAAARRFLAYRWAVRLASLGAAAALAFEIWRRHATPL